MGHNLFPPQDLWTLVIWSAFSSSWFLMCVHVFPHPGTSCVLQRCVWVLASSLIKKTFSEPFSCACVELSLAQESCRWVSRLACTAVLSQLYVTSPLFPLYPGHSLFHSSHVSTLFLKILGEFLSLILHISESVFYTIIFLHCFQSGF